MLFSVPDECPEGGGLAGCPTCCCESSDNVEFYDPDAPEPECTAPPAVYNLTFTTTWTNTCHPDTFVENSQWESLRVMSHNPDYRLWDACMDDLPHGPSTLEGDVVIAILKGQIADAFPTSPIGKGAGTVTENIEVDSSHQFVSAYSRQTPSPNYLVGVADLRLCDGDRWRENVKVCFELFSISERVAPEMQRNSVQGNNCSYGYIEFQFNHEVRHYIIILLAPQSLVVCHCLHVATKVGLFRVVSSLHLCSW